VQGNGRERLMDHQTGDGLLKRVIDTQDELETVYSALRAIAANPDDNWTGWRHAVEMLIPDSIPRLQELEAELRDKGLGQIADRLEALRT
jgi:hypothetical protein